MTGAWLPLLATVLAAALTYLCCIRPMRRKDSCCAAIDQHTAESLDDEIHRTREELRTLRKQAAARAVPPRSRPWWQTR
ncbi:hypothetical protein AB0K02_27735 [Streptomyces sp. NPDC049597]|uniref:hypothetical protein n=1 Tax=Streptomyces sp. NPDC049597 TaxID=3155276 RepID=UPI003440E32B